MPFLMVLKILNQNKKDMFRYFELLLSLMDTSFFIMKKSFYLIPFFFLK